MKNSYDYTKDEKYKSYEQFVYKSLIELGFRVTNVGTMYLKDLILFAYFNNYYEINVTKIVKKYMKYKNINQISNRTFINCIEYAIKTCNFETFKSRFRLLFNINLDSYFFSLKNILTIIIHFLLINND